MEVGQDLHYLAHDLLGLDVLVHGPPLQIAAPVHFLKRPKEPVHLAVHQGHLMRINGLRLVDQGPALSHFMRLEAQTGEAQTA